MHFSRKLCLWLAFVFVCHLARAQTVSKAFQITSTSTANCPAIDVGGNATVGIDVSGTFSATLQPQVIIGGGNTARNTAVTPYGSTTSQATITATGGYHTTDIPGATYFILCASSYVSGTATVVLTITPASAKGGGGGGAGTVTGITAGTGLTGGTINTSGTIALAVALPNGETATTQTATDTSTKVATDGFAASVAPGFVGGVDGSFGYVSGDPCATIAANLTTAVATNPQSVDLYLGKFANIFPNGLVPCLSNPFENQVFSGHIYLGPIQIIKSVPWITPGNNQRVGIYGDGTSDPGIAIASTASTLTDCDADAPTWDGVDCEVNGVTVPAFPSTGHCITFTYPHGSFGAATYCPTLWLGGMGASGVNFGGSFGSVIQDFTIQPGNGGGNFGVYSAGIQEQSYCLNVVVRDSNNSGFFFDKVQGNGSGPGHFKMTSCTARAGLNGVTQLAAQGYPNVANQIGMGYGIWFEGNGIVVYFTGGTCTTYPQGYPTTIAGGAVTVIKMTYAGSCSNVTGLTCHIGSQHGGTGETCAATTSVNTVTGITAGGVGTGYSLGDTQTGGAFEIEDATINGKNTQNMQEAIVMEGIFSPTVRSIHTGFDAGWGVHVGYGGGTVVGGVFENMDLENTSNGVLHFGVGIDNNQIVLGTGRGGSVASIQDDQNNFTSGTNIPCSIYEPGTLSTCIAGGVTVISNTDTTHVPLTVNGFTGQSSDLQDWAVIGIGNVATVTPAGAFSAVNAIFTTPANVTTVPLSIVQGAMSSSFATAALNVSQGANTGATNVPGGSFSGTWNNAAIAGPFFKIAVTNTSSAGGSPIFQVFGGAGGVTSEFQTTTGGVSISPVAFQSALFEGLTLAAGTQFCGGPCTASLGGGAGLSLFQGGDNSNIGATVTGGGSVFRGGMLTNATPNAAALEGVTQLAAGALKGSAVAALGDVLCGTTTAFTLTDCSITGPAVNIVGIATSTANPIGYITNGQALVKTDGAVTIGDILCMGTTTAGQAHDNGTVPCLTAGSMIGVVLATSGTINTATGATSAGTAMSTTLPLVALNIHPVIAGMPATSIVTGADYTNATATPSTVWSFTLPATAAAKNYKYVCEALWESTAATLVGPVIGLNISAAPTQITGSAWAQSTLTGTDSTGYLSNATTGSQTLITGAAAGVTSTNYRLSIWGTIEAAPIAGSTFIINAASTSGTTALLNIRRGGWCTLQQIVAGP